MRGVSLASGAKAMLLDRGESSAAPRYVLAVMSASKRVNWKVGAVPLATRSWCAEVEHCRVTSRCRL